MEGAIPSDLMRYRIADFGEMYGRGVWLSPFLSERGEYILVAVTSQRRMVAQETIPVGADHAAVAEQLWDLLERIEPEDRQIRLII